MIDDLSRWSLGASAEQSAVLLTLVLSGHKRATSGSLFAYEIEGEPLPEPGTMSVIADWQGEPACLIRTTAVTVRPFCEFTFETVSREGEDETLASWQHNHREFFTAEGETLGYTFTEHMPVVVEEFELVEVLAGSNGTDPQPR